MDFRIPLGPMRLFQIASRLFVFLLASLAIPSGGFALPLNILGNAVYSFEAESSTAEGPWQRFRLRNDSLVPETAVVHPAGLFPSSFQYGIYSKEGRRLRSGEGGLNSRFSQREDSSYQAFFSLTLGPGEERIVHLRVAQDGPAFPKILVIDRESWEKADRDHTLFMGVALGGCVILLLYSFFTYLRLRDSVLASYLFFVFANLLAIAYWNGAHSRWMEAYPPWMLAILPAIPRLAGWGACLLAVSLVRLPRRRPMLNSFLVGVMALSLLILIPQMLWPEAIARIGDLCNGLLLAMSVAILVERVWGDIDWHILLMTTGITVLASLTLKVSFQGDFDDLSNLSLAHVFATFMVSVGLIMRLQFKREKARVVMREAGQGQVAEIQRLNRDIEAYKELARNLERKLSAQKEFESGGLRAVGEVAANVAEEMQLSFEAFVKMTKDCLIEIRSGQFKNAQRRAEKILRMTMRIENVMRNLQRATAGEARPELLSVNDFIKDCIGLCQERLGKAGIEIEVQFLDEDASVNGSFADLLQVFLAMLANARDAMAGVDIKKITLQLSTIEADGKDWVQMQFSDSGLGVPTSIKKNIFKPFYSTKEEHGGMGLVRAKTIVKTHGGSVWLNPDAVTTTFVLRLPLVRKAEAKRLAS